MNFITQLSWAWKLFYNLEAKAPAPSFQSLLWTRPPNMQIRPPIGPPAKRHSDGVSLAGRYLPDLRADWEALKSQSSSEQRIWLI